MKTMPVEPTYLKVVNQGRPVGVDREARVLRGYVVALAGAIKDGRGEFDELSLQQIRDHGNAAPGGLKSRFTHPTASDDGLGKFLGRARDFQLGTATVKRDGKTLDLPAVRADLHFADSASETPNGDLAGYVMKLAQEDPEALSSSIVLRPKKEVRLNADGTRQKDAQGADLPPLWRVEKLHASDIVDEGAAVDGILSIDPSGLPDELQRRGVDMLDQIFADQPREVVEARVLRYLGRYLDLRYGDPEAEQKREKIRARVAQLRQYAG